MSYPSNYIVYIPDDIENILRSKKLEIEEYSDGLNDKQFEEIINKFVLLLNEKTNTLKVGCIGDELADICLEIIEDLDLIVFEDMGDDDIININIKKLKQIQIKYEGE
jgi:hypothetical protein